ALPRADHAEPVRGLDGDRPEGLAPAGRTPAAASGVPVRCRASRRRGGAPDRRGEGPRLQRREDRRGLLQVPEQDRNRRRRRGAPRLPSTAPEAARRCLEIRRCGSRDTCDRAVSADDALTTGTGKDLGRCQTWLRAYGRSRRPQTVSGQSLHRLLPHESAEEGVCRTSLTTWRQSGRSLQRLESLSGRIRSAYCAGLARSSASVWRGICTPTQLMRLPAPQEHLRRQPPPRPRVPAGTSRRLWPRSGRQVTTSLQLRSPTTIGLRHLSQSASSPLPPPTCRTQLVSQDAAGSFDRAIRSTTL